MHENINNVLNSYGRLRTFGNQVRVCVSAGSRNDRIKILNQISENLASYGAVVLYDNPRYSSIGYVKVDNLKISVKSENRQDKLSAGIPNEEILVQKINKYLEVNESINLIFFSDIFTISYENIEKCFATGNRKARRRRNKADMIMSTKTCNYCFSIKQKDAERWESADTICGIEAKKRLNTMVESGKVKITNVLDSNGNCMYRSGNASTPIVKIEPEIHWEMDTEQQKKIMFGDDIKETGAILINTFKENDFEFDENTKTLKVKCDRIYTTETKILEQDVPYWMIRNDVTRNCLKIGMMGVRIEAVFGSRITKNGVKG